VRALRVALVLATAAGALALAAPATASELKVDVQLEALVLAGLPGEANGVTVAYDSGRSGWRVTDVVGITIETSVPCVSEGPTAAFCRAPIWFILGDGDDRFEATSAATPFTTRIERVKRPEGYTVVEIPVGVNVRGGPGNDTLIGHDAHDVLYGGDGRQTPGSGNDTIVGRGQDDHLVGEDGNDRIEGGAGYDEISGNNGDDRLEGGEDDDSMEVMLVDEDGPRSPGNDHLEGGPGRDYLGADQGRDVAFGGPGDDVVAVTPGVLDDPLAKADGLRSVATCGPGNDLVDVGNGDTVRSDCERLITYPWCPERCTVSLRTRIRGRTRVLLRREVRAAGSVSLVRLPLAAPVRTRLAVVPSVRVEAVSKMARYRETRMVRFTVTRTPR
jgi:RTX calcium-binding nonapeptide repeat (4 copies)